MTLHILHGLKAGLVVMLCSVVTLVCVECGNTGVCVCVVTLVCVVCGNTGVCVCVCVVCVVTLVCVVCGNTVRDMTGKIRQQSVQYLHGIHLQQATNVYLCSCFNWRLVDTLTESSLAL